MCGRLNQSLDPADLADELEITAGAYVHRELYNDPPGSTVPIIVERPDADGVLTRRLEPASWGLVPGWADDLAIGRRAFNARAETVSSKPMFRSAFASKRCAVPVAGYYEWERTDDGRTPWLMSSVGSDFLLFAGLFEQRRLSEDELASRGADPAVQEGWLISSTILTTESTGHLAEVHDRMPVILTAAQAQAWIDPQSGKQEAQALLDGFIRGFDPHTVQRWKVGTAVGNARLDGAELAQPA